MKRPALVLVALYIILGAFVPGCNRRAELATRPPANTAALRIIHACPNSPPLDVYIGESPIAQDIAFEGSTEYRDIEAGSRTITFYPYGTTVNPVLETSLRLDDGERYTVMAIGRLEEIRSLVLRDSEYTPPRDRAGVRFVHAIPDAPDLDLRVITTNTTLAKAVDFGKASRYQTIDPGVYELGINIGNLETTIKRLPNVEIQQGRAYTVVALGELTLNTTSVKVFEDTPERNIPSMRGR